MKRFLEWIRLKEKLDNGNHRPPFVSKGDIWWASIGENVGSEINGKSGLFSRPVIIFKKLSHSFYLVIPTTTKVKKGDWYVSFVHKGIESVASLHQMRTLDFRRLSNKLGTIDDEDFRRVRQGFIGLYI